MTDLEKFLNLFSDNELFQLARLLSRIRCLPVNSPASAKRHLQSVSYSHLVDLLHGYLFGGHEDTAEAAQRLEENLPLFKCLLSAFPTGKLIGGKTADISNTCCFSSPPIPKQFVGEKKQGPKAERIFNGRHHDQTGKRVIVSDHAWLRFCFRFIANNFPRYRQLETIRKNSGNNNPMEFYQRFFYEKLWEVFARARPVNNGSMDSAERKLYDQNSDLEFVIRNDEVLVTCEIPTIRPS